jgi:hypothetical protein
LERMNTNPVLRGPCESYRGASAPIRSTCHTSPSEPIGGQRKGIYSTSDQ